VQCVMSPRPTAISTGDRKIFNMVYVVLSEPLSAAVHAAVIAWKWQEGGRAGHPMPLRKQHAPG
jgi:hypothetical protein